MPPQIDKLEPFGQNENIDQSLVDQNKNIIQTQNYLLILLYIQWIVFFVTLGVGLYSVLSGNAADLSSGLQSLIPVLVLFIYYSFGILVTYKKNRIGLLIFATIGVIVFIALFLLVGYIVLVIIGLAVGFGGNIGRAYTATALIGLLFAVVAIIAVMSLKLTFDLAKLVKTKEYLPA